MATHRQTTAVTHLVDYEKQNREILEHYDAVEVTVARNENGQVVNAVATYADGETDVLFRASLRGIRPESVQITTTRREG
jgi:hypothetical protein